MPSLASIAARIVGYGVPVALTTVLLVYRQPEAPTQDVTHAFMSDFVECSVYRSADLLLGWSGRPFQQRLDSVVDAAYRSGCIVETERRFDTAGGQALQTPRPARRP